MLTREQLAELDRLSRTDPRAGMRVKVIAVRAVALGASRQQVGALLNVSPYSVGQWYQAYGRAGLAALEIRQGRGRPSQVDAKEVEEYVRQSPRNFGLARTRWTLQLLAENVPSLKGLRPHAVWYALQRAGISYKRVEAWLHSPDADYVKKNATSKTSSPKRGSSRKK
jgi:transposase